MRKARFSEEQMVAIICEADREPVSGIAKRHGISEQTIYTWRERFVALQANDVGRLRQLETENARLKKLVAERSQGQEPGALISDAQHLVELVRADAVLARR